MIRKRDQLPAKLSHLQGPCVSFDLLDKDGHYGYFAVSLRGPTGYGEIHNIMERWSHSLMRQLLETDFEQFKEACRALGVKRFVARKSGPDPKWVKFIKRFGFSEPRIVLVAQLEV